MLSPVLTKRVAELETLIPQFSPTVEQKDKVTENQALITDSYEYDMKPDGTILEFRGEAVIEK